MNVMATKAFLTLLNNMNLSLLTGEEFSVTTGPGNLYDGGLSTASVMDGRTLIFYFGWSTLYTYWA